MSQYFDNGCRPFTAGAQLDQYMLVTLSGGQVVLAGAADDNILGATRNRCDSGDPVTVCLRSKAGTMKLKAAAAVAEGVLVYAAANGEADDTGTNIIGISLEAAAAGDVFEVMPV